MESQGGRVGLLAGEDRDVRASGASEVGDDVVAPVCFRYAQA